MNVSKKQERVCGCIPWTGDRGGETKKRSTGSQKNRETSQILAMSKNKIKLKEILTYATERMKKVERAKTCFFSGCCLGRFRAVRPSVSEAKMKRDATAIVSRLQCKFSKNMQGVSQSHKRTKGEGNEIQKGGQARSEEEGHRVKPWTGEGKVKGLWEIPWSGGEKEEGERWKRGQTTVKVHVYGHGNYKTN